MINDPISDMLTRIRNASASKKSEVVLPYSRVKHEIANILNQEGYVGKVTKVVADNQIEGKVTFPELRIGLKYSDDQKSVISNLKRISKPGLRIYRKSYQLPIVLNNFGTAIISTSQGMMTNKKARKHGLGGEVVCEVY